MAVTIKPTRLPVDATRQDDLRKLFVSSGYNTLKEMVAARCIEYQAKAFSASMYSDTAEQAKQWISLAMTLNAVLDCLDDYEKTEELWFTVRLDT